MGVSPFTIHHSRFLGRHLQQQLIHPPDEPRRVLKRPAFRELLFAPSDAMVRDVMLPNPSW